eukprot:GHVR01142844.1.p1 GENE.GHVR01142844.1~~GHVR01142844.1.p1  ORF type:complete len:126 (+),score=21.87 GHVR01142844.1:165-542(+)
MKSLISIGMLGVVSCNSMANNSINTNDSSDCANPTANTNFFKGTLTAATRQIKIEGDTCGNGAKTNFFTVGLRTDMFGIFLNINDKKFIEKSLEKLDYIYYFYLLFLFLFIIYIFIYYFYLYIYM